MDATNILNGNASGHCHGRILGAIRLLSEPSLNGREIPLLKLSGLPSQSATGEPHVTMVARSAYLLTSSCLIVKYATKAPYAARKKLEIGGIERRKAYRVTVIDHFS